MNSTKVVLIPVFLFIIILSCSRKKTNNAEIVNIKESVIESPISILAYMDAALNGNSDKVKKFIAGGLVVDTTDKNGSTAMMLAAYNGHTEIVKTQKAAGADIYIKDKDGETARDFASNNCHSVIVKLIDNNKN